ncbi:MULTISPECIES: tail fiber domain-containing protein [Prauserella salsuginis group]|uniref:Tail fiber domain-containing protein n=1 Tax=Prauserella salsuginis TaxID=387889 RepID=A0ABW6G5P5_9PSEU|nr:MULTISPECIES: tail fiber domain-containing protein [Prauserella salsuginis group]MCR3719128.1 hypothetical protein [Prauserella flava]MCR3735859.1 hypothetical protein [Prauserella salsuginis]
MTTRTGRIDTVWLDYHGVNLTADAPAGSTVLTVEHVADFDEAGGDLLHVPTGEVYAYDTVDTTGADDTIILTDPLPTGVGFAEGDAIRIWPLVTDAYAHIQLEDDADNEPIVARIQHPLRGQVAEGSRQDLEREMAFVEFTGREWVVRDVVGRDDAVWFGELRTDHEGNKRIVINKRGESSPVEIRLYPYDGDDDAWSTLGVNTDVNTGNVGVFLYPSTRRADGGYAGLSATEDVAQLLHVQPDATPGVRTTIAASEDTFGMRSGYGRMTIDGQIPNVDGTNLRRITIEHLDSAGAAVPNATLWLRREHGVNNSPWIAAPERNSGILFGADRVYITGGDQALSSSSHGPLTCSSLTQSSSREDKTNVNELTFDPVAAVSDATAYTWNYRSEADDAAFVHVGPMAEDLPSQVLQHDGDGKPLVDLGSLVGVLWAAVQQLSGEVADLKSQLGQP